MIENQTETTQTDTDFGFTRVPLDAKQQRVDQVFHSVAARYDVMNDLMSGFLHRAWKDRFVTLLQPPQRRGFQHLDVAGGTGDIAFRVAKAGGSKTKVTVLDINGDMLAVGRERAAKKHLRGQIEFIEGNAETLPFADNSFDAYTIAFGIRNVPRINAALAEAYRVLRRGGRFMCLEFSHVDNAVLDKIYEAYSFHAIPRIGQLIAGDAEAYRYLVESIRRFPAAEDFAAMIAEAGFERASFSKLSGGIVAIHSGWKL